MELRKELVDAAAAHRKNGRPTALFVRHAERHAIEDLARHDEVLLTVNGHACAFAAGRLVGDGVLEEVALFHSPVPRCRETAQGLHKGLVECGRRARLVGERAAFGASYLKDHAGLATAYAKHGKNFVRAWFNGEVDTAFIDSCAVVATRQLEAVAACLQAHPLAVVVSHDWNIAALKEHALGLRFEDHGWPRFLDGVVCSLGGDGRVVVESV